MVQIIERRPDFILERGVVFLTVSKADEDGYLNAEWRCSAHAGAIVGRDVGIRSGIQEASAAFLKAVAYAHEHQIEYMVIEDPKALFPPERHLQAI